MESDHADLTKKFDSLSDLRFYNYTISGERWVICKCSHDAQFISTFWPVFLVFFFFSSVLAHLKEIGPDGRRVEWLV
jgi:hypothetical protein